MRYLLDYLFAFWALDLVPSQNLISTLILGCLWIISCNDKHCNILVCVLLLSKMWIKIFLKQKNPLQSSFQCLLPFNHIYNASWWDFLLPCHQFMTCACVKILQYFKYVLAWSIRVSGLYVQMLLSSLQRESTKDIFLEVSAIVLFPVYSKDYVQTYS